MMKNHTKWYSIMVANIFYGLRLFSEGFLIIKRARIIFFNGPCVYLFNTKPIPSPKKHFDLYQCLDLRYRVHESCHE